LRLRRRKLVCRVALDGLPCEPVATRPPRHCLSGRPHAQTHLAKEVARFANLRRAACALGVREPAGTYEIVGPPERPGASRCGCAGIGRPREIEIDAPTPARQHPTVRGRACSRPTGGSCDPRPHALYQASVTNPRASAAARSTSA